MLTRRPRLALAGLCAIVFFTGHSAVQGGWPQPPAVADSVLPPDEVIAVDPAGIPVICRHAPATEKERTTASMSGVATLSSSPTGTRSWECVPGVIRDNGEDTFHIEVTAETSITAIRLDTLSPKLLASGVLPLAFRDDGLEGDRTAGDSVWTSPPVRYNPALPVTGHYWNDSASPAGLTFVDVGSVTLTESSGANTQFLLGPSVGVLSSAIPAADPVVLSSTILATSHLVNIRNDSAQTQRFLRNLGSDLHDVTTALYEVLPDLVDFFVFISSRKIEVSTAPAPQNFQAGKHLGVHVNWTGTGQAPFDDSALFGSAGRLLGLIALDVGSRGVNSGNLTHEILHQWAAYTHSALGLADGTGHYKPRASVGSLIGGQAWTAHPDGSYTMNCEEGPSGAHHAAPLTLYMMGLAPASQVPDIHVYSEASPLPLDRCNQVIDDIVQTVSIDQIQGAHGIRSPGPDAARKDFRLVFVVESAGRLLNTTEMTFYQLLAEHYTRPVAPGAPDPYIGFNWASIERFFAGANFTSILPVGSRYDLDGDLDVDQGDFGLLQTCMTGPGVGPPATGCAAADFDGDSDVDFDDMARFQVCRTAPGIPADPGCDPAPPPLPPGAAEDPAPPSQATDVPVGIVLSWTAGSGATQHDVYFGDTNPPVFRASQSAISFDPGILQPATTYYWRIDERNAVGVTSGSLWRFTTAAAATSCGGVLYAPPAGGWTYCLSGDEAVAGSAGLFDSLDGTWDHGSNSDDWDGSAIGGALGAGNKPGGVSSLVEGAGRYLRIQDTGDPADYGYSLPSNRKIYFAHDLTARGAPDNALTAGITVCFRARIATGEPVDAEHPDGGFGVVAWPPDGKGYANASDGRGNIGIHQKNGGTISFSLGRASDNGVGAGLFMNNRNGAALTGVVDPGESGEKNLFPLSDPTVWHEFWITIVGDTSGGGSHRVSVYADGSLVPVVFHVTAGTAWDYADISYLAMGTLSTTQAGAIDIDFVSWKSGVAAPVLTR